MTSGTLTNTNEKGHNVSKQKRRRTAKGAADTSLSRINNKGLKWFRRHTQADTDVWSLCEWERRTAEISDDNGRIVFRQENVEVPKHWSNLALNIVASKYFQGKPGTSERETSVRQMIYRVAHTIACWGREDGYFASEEDAKIFEDELTYLLLFQHASFNSPVWFNVGHEERPQCSACFINSVEDSMESILNLAKTEGMLFKYGSGTGSNLSTLRSSRESLRGGGVASGPVSFMKGFDAFAGVIKSGGKTRRAAKMVILNVEHPDIMEFIECKYREEKKAHALIDAGYDGSVNGEAYSSVFFQNANHSVRVSDTFMKAVLEDGPWHTKAVTTGTIMETYRARDIMRKIAECTHACGDPGLQFHDTINTWHTCKASGPIVASNPCSEYMFLNDTACNLASINLLHYLQDDHFDTEGFSFACETMITAQEIIVDRASYPKPEIADNSHKYRPLGLGYANLGALLMTLGIPYDSEEARSIAAYITALMTGRAYLQSAHLARIQGCFEEFPKNRDSMLEVMRKHQKAVEDVPLPETPTLWKKALFSDLRSAAEEAWKEAVALGEKYGYRNSQATVLAPTGTIAFMMDCDTTGIEPDIALVKYKRLSGGGTLKIVNRSVGEALRKLGYSSEEIKKISAYIDANDTIEGAPGLREEDLPVFDCAFRPLKGTRSIEPMGHVRMMAAVQPFLSGAISKTVNMPHDATVEEIEKTYIEAWKLGLKAIAIYRDGCKRSQPLSTSEKSAEDGTTDKPSPGSLSSPKTTSSSSRPAPALQPYRRRLPSERTALTHRFEIEGHEGYITVGLYEDGTPGEIFLRMSKEGSTISGLMDTIATLTSMALQYGVPLKVLVRKFSHMRFEPSGFTKNPEIPIAKSIVDYTFRWLAAKFLSPEECKSIGIVPRERKPSPGRKKDSPATGTKYEENTPPKGLTTTFSFQNQSDAPLCSFCGSITVRNASCYICPTCGSSNGCS